MKKMSRGIVNVIGFRFVIIFIQKGRFWDRDFKYENIYYKYENIHSHSSMINIVKKETGICN